MPDSLSDVEPRPNRLLLLIVTVEVFLVLIAWICGWIGFYFLPQPWPEFVDEFAWVDVLIGVALGGVLFGFVDWLERLPNRLSLSLQKVILEVIGPKLRPLNIWQIAIISIAAGVGEELFFRWALQGGLAQYVSPWIALVIASFVFGLLHSVNLAYLVMATFLGAVLGSIMIISEGILAPIVCHAVFDFIAIMYIKRRIGP